MVVYITKAQLATLAKLDAAKDKAVSAIFAAAPNNITPFNVCYDMATPAERAAYEDACHNRREFQYQLQAQGRGWWNNGVFTPYHKRG